VLLIVLHYPYLMATSKKPIAKAKVKVLDVSGTEPKTKVKTKADKTEVAVLKNKVAASITKGKAARISKLNRDGMVSILGDSSEEIMQLLEVDKNESATSLIQKRLLQSLVDVLPYAEHNVRESKGQRSVYQLNSLITSLREVLIDIQSTKDKSALGEALVEKILRPLFLDLGMLLIQENAKTDGFVKDLVSPEHFKEIRKSKAESLERVAAFIQSKYGDAKVATIAFLST
jgi:hypothetical protein